MIWLLGVCIGNCKELEIFSVVLWGMCFFEWERLIEVSELMFFWYYVIEKFWIDFLLFSFEWMYDLEFLCLIVFLKVICVEFWIFFGWLNFCFVNFLDKFEIFFWDLVMFLKFWCWCKVLNVFFFIVEDDDVYCIFEYVSWGFVWEMYKWW